MAQGRFRVGLDFVKGDTSGIKSIQTEISKLLNLLKNPAELKVHGLEGMDAEISAATSELEKFQSAINKSFNYRLNSVDIIKFNQELQNSETSLDELRSKLYGLGPTGVAQFRNLTASLFDVKTELKETHVLLDKMRETLSNTIRWTIASTALNTLSGSVQRAWGFAKSLDSSLNDIRIVTEKSTEEMDSFAQKANKAAKALGSNTNQYAKASLIYYQQGLSDKEVEKRAATTIKAANVTKQGADSVSEQLTAIWNGYKVAASEAELYIDKVSAVAATTAADLEEMAEGMQKVASAANSMGVDIDQLNAMLATIVSVTREDSSAVGTALKTIFSRMGDLSVDGVDEFGVSLGDVSGKLQTMGIDILDQEDNLRDMGTIIEEVASKWNTWTSAQQQAAAVALAGKRQYNNLIALFENWNMYESAKTTSQTGAGTLQKQNEIYLDSIDAKLNKIQTSAEGLYNSLIDTDGFKDLFDVFSVLISLTDQFVQGLGGGMSVLGGLIQVSSKLFSSKAGDFLKTYMVNRQQNARARTEAPIGVKTAQEAYNTSLAGDNTITELIKAQRARRAAVPGSEEEQRLNNLIEELKSSEFFKKIEDKTQLDDEDYLQKLQSESKRNMQIASMEKERYIYGQYLNEETRQEFKERISSLNDYYNKLNDVNLAIEQEEERHKEATSKAQEETTEKQQKFYNKQISSIEDSIKILKEKDAKELQRLEEKARKEEKAYNDLRVTQENKYAQAQDKIKSVTKDDTYNFDNAASRRRAFGRISSTISELSQFKKKLTINVKEDKSALDLKKEAKNLYTEFAESYKSILTPEDFQTIQSVHADKIASIKKATTQEDATKAIQAFYDSIAGAIENTIKETKAAVKEIKKYNPNNEALAEAREAAVKARIKASADTTLTAEETQQIKDLKASEQWLKYNLKDVDIGTLNTEELENLKEKVKLTNDLTEKQQEFVKALIEEKQNKDKTEDERYKKTSEDSKKEQEILSAKINQSVEEWDAEISKIKYQMIGEGIAEVTGAVAGLTGAMNTLINVTNIWENDNLTAWEKFSQTIISIGGGFVSLTSSISQFNGGINKALEGLNIRDMSVQRNLVLLDEEQAEYAQSILVKRIYNALTEEEKQSLDATTKERIENNESLDAEQLQRLKDVAGGHKAQTLGDKIKGVFTKDFWKQKGAGIKGKFVGTNGQLTGGAVVSGVALAITGVIMMGKAISEVVQQEKNAVIQAEKNLAVAQENLQVAERNAETVRNNLSAYEETAKSLDTLVEGTDAWREATSKLTDEVLTLISIYPELAEYATRDPNTGVLTLTEAGQEKAKELAQRREAQSRAIMYGAAADKASADRTLAYTNFLRENDDIDNVISGFETDTTTDGEWSHAKSGSAGLALGAMGLGTAGAALVGAKIGLAIGTAAGGPIGAAVGAAVGLAVGGLSLLITEWVDNNEDRERQVLDGVAKVIAENPSALKDEATLRQVLDEKLNLNDDKLVSALWENKEETLALAKQMEASRKAQQLQAEQEAYNFLVSKYGDTFENSQFASQIARVQALEETPEEFLNQVAWMTDAQIQAKYSEITGASGATNKFGGSGVYVYTDAEGNKSNVEVDDKTARAAVARQLALESKASFSAIEETLIEVTKDFDEAGKKAVANALTENSIDRSFNSLTQAQVKVIQGMESKLTDTLDITDEEFDKLNNDYEIAWRNIQVKYGNFLNSLNVNLADLTLQGMTTAGILNEKIGGQGSLYQSILSNLNETQTQNFINSLQDFDDYSDISVFKAALEDFQLVEEIGADTIHQLTQQLQIAFDIWDDWDLSKAQENAKLINDILDKVKDFGDTIEASQYSQLSSEAQKYFLLMADGQYALYKDAEEFYNLVRGQQNQANYDAIFGITQQAISDLGVSFSDQEAEWKILTKLLADKSTLPYTDTNPLEQLAAILNSNEFSNNFLSNYGQWTIVQGAQRFIPYENVSDYEIGSIIREYLPTIEPGFNLQNAVDNERALSISAAKTPFNEQVKNLSESILNSFGASTSLSSFKTLYDTIFNDKAITTIFGSSWISEETQLLIDDLYDKAEAYEEYFTKLAQNESFENFSKNLEERLNFSDSTEKIQVLSDALEQFQKLEIDETQRWETLPDLVQQAHDAIDEFYDSQISYIQHLNDLTDTQISLAKLRYGEEADVAELQKLQSNNLNQISALQEDRYNKLKDMEDVSAETLISAASSYTQALYAEAEALHEQYVTNVEKQLNSLTKELSNQMSLNELSEEWDWVTSQADRYLNKIDQVYSLQNLTNKFDKAAMAAGEKNLRRINELRDRELKILKDKVKLSKYEVDRVERLLELEQARIALEQSQSANTQMQLVRGADGRYSYQYTQDEDAIAERRAQMEQKEQELLNSSLEAYESNTKAFADAYAKYTENLQEAYADGNVSEFERQKIDAARIETEQYAALAKSAKENLIKDLEESSVLATEGMTAAEWVAKNISPTTTGAATLVEEIANGSDVFTKMENAVASAAEEFKTDMTTIENKIKAVNDEQLIYIDNLTSVGDALSKKDGVNDSLSTLITNLQKLQDEIDKLNLTNQLKNTASADSLKNYMINAMASENKTIIINGIQYSAKELSSIIGNRTDKEAIQSSVNDSIADNNSISTETASKYGFYKENKTPGLGMGEENKDSPYEQWKNKYTGESITLNDKVYARENVDENYLDGNKDNKILTWSDSDLNNDGHAYLDKNDNHYAADMTNGATVTALQGNAAQITFTSKLSGMKGGNQKTVWVKLEDLVKADATKAPNIASALTGGYTGEWGSEGKFLEVHEKELILNKEDTVNILRAVDVVRSLETSAFERIASLLNNFNPEYQITNSGQSMEIDQNVHITAEFPNVVNREEIEDAFKDLVNLASQRAYKNTRT